jgi:cytochrome c oxidase cbb3-type subunit IV
MNLIKEYLGSVAGADVFAIISMFIFLVMFLFMIYHTYSLRKDEVREYSNLPLEEEESDQK